MNEVKQLTDCNAKAINVSSLRIAHQIDLINKTWINIYVCKLAMLPCEIICAVLCVLVQKGKYSWIIYSHFMLTKLTKQSHHSRATFNFDWNFAFAKNLIELWKLATDFVVCVQHVTILVVFRNNIKTKRLQIIVQKQKTKLHWIHGIWFWCFSLSFWPVRENHMVIWI